MTRRALFVFAVALLAAGLAGCAAGGAGTASSNTNRDLLTLEDLAPYEAMDAYAVVRRLRSFWLNPRATGSFGIDPDVAGSQAQIQVYIDGVRSQDGVEALKQVNVSEVREMRHLDGRDATMQYGSDHGAGAILVVTGR